MSEQTYRNPLFGQRVDRYIPPELRQGLGAVLALGDMLNPVSAYREYIRDVGEEDYPSAAANLAGFVAPGAAGAIASRLGRSGIRAIEPYSDDAARALMEMLSPTGAPDVSRGAEGMSRREFLAGLGAAAATPALPVDEMLGGLGRVGARGGVGLSGRLGALAGLRSGMSKIADEMRELDPNLRSHTLSREIDDLVSGNFDIDDYGKVLSQADISKMIDERRAEISRIQESLVDPGSRLADLRGNYSGARDDLLGSMVVDTDEYIGELGELGDDELRSLASEVGQFFSNIDNVARLKRGGYDPSEIVSSMGRFGSALRDEVARRDLGEDVLGDVEYLVGEALPEVAFAYRVGPEPKSVRSGGVDEFGFVSDDFGVAPRMVGGVEDFGRGLGSVRMPAAEASQGRAIIRPDDLFRGEGVPRITVRQTNQPFVARGTEQDQIDDMIQSGLVRPKVGGYGKEKKSDLYFGESPAALPTDIRQRPSESRFVLVGDSEKLAGTEGPIPIDQLRHVWVVRNGDTVDVLPEILRANRAFGGAQYRPD